MTIRRVGKRRWTFRTVPSPLPVTRIPKAANKEFRRWQTILNAVCGRPWRPIEYPVLIRVKVVRRQMYYRSDRKRLYVDPIIKALSTVGWAIDTSDEWAKVEVEIRAKEAPKDHKTIIEWEPLYELREE